MAILDDISQAAQIGKKKDVVALVEQAVSEGVAPDEILNVALIPAMDVVGDKFSKNEIFVPEMLVAARAMAAGTEILKPLLAQGGAEPLGKACIGTVKGDLHDIGKNLVRMMMEGKGIEIHDLGVDVPAEAFVDYIKEHEDLQLVCISALLTTTMPRWGTPSKRSREQAGVTGSRSWAVAPPLPRNSLIKSVPMPIPAMLVLLQVRPQSSSQRKKARITI